MKFFFKRKLFIIVIKLDPIVQPWNPRSDSLFNPGLKLIHIRVDSIWDPKTIGKAELSIKSSTVPSLNLKFNSSTWKSIIELNIS